MLDLSMPKSRARSAMVTRLGAAAMVVVPDERFARSWDFRSGLYEREPAGAFLAGGFISLDENFTKYGNTTG